MRGFGFFENTEKFRGAKRILSVYKVLHITGVIR